MIVALVLAAGSSERMGRPKALLPCGERTFLGAILETLADSLVDDVRVVLGHGAEEIKTALGLSEEIYTVNLNHEAGMLSSIRCGLRALPARTTGFLLWPSDHPLVRRATVDLLVETFRGGEHLLVLPVHRSRRGHPVVFAASLAAELMKAPDAVGARAVVRAHAGELHEVEVDDPGTVQDINTPEAYAAAFGRPLPRP